MAYPLLSKLDDIKDEVWLFEKINKPFLSIGFKTIILNEIGDFQKWILQLEWIIKSTDHLWYQFYQAGPFNFAGISDPHKQYIVSVFDGALKKLISNTVSERVNIDYEDFLQSYLSNCKITSFDLLEILKIEYDRVNAEKYFRENFEWLQNMDNFNTTQKMLRCQRLVHIITEPLVDKIQMTKETKNEIDDFKQQIAANLMIALSPNHTQEILRHYRIGKRLDLYDITNTIAYLEDKSI
ncbi:Family of unknown function (DUF5314) [Nakaseomyces glabratus]|nr:Family of unknown function (DUF5314) [Nakaseomyces glabratus]KAH7580247.1 Family of unknown function (DUF5314) [Nakaseomyces glabratus]KAI8392188.1 Family of unknown function (DUF5314) [Nakaseomyces glabratus]